MAGNVNDIVSACGLIEGLLANKLLADRAYNVNKFSIWRNIKAILLLYLQCRADWFNASMTLTSTRNVISLSVSLLSLNHSAELLLDTISFR